MQLVKRLKKLFTSNPHLQMCSMEECALQRYGVGAASSASSATSPAKIPNPQKKKQRPQCFCAWLLRSVTKQQQKKQLTMSPI